MTGQNQLMTAVPAVTDQSPAVVARRRTLGPGPGRQRRASATRRQSGVSRVRRPAVAAVPSGHAHNAEKLYRGGNLSRILSET